MSAEAPKPTGLKFDSGYFPAFESKLFIEGADIARRLLNFFVLLLSATFIATYGVLSASTATVIGAMIVAPLMQPIMATTAAVVMGQLERALRSLALVAIGIVVVITAAFVLTLVVPDVTISFTDNGEITSRIQPGLYALLTALGSGVAGAYITSRPELSDSMGGVAIAISLVPPLCVVGISLQQGQWDAAGGALLLFVTNALAILLAGGVVFRIIGVGDLATTKEQKAMRTRSFAVFIIGILLIAIPLTVVGYQTYTQAQETSTATAQVQQWIGDATYETISVAPGTKDVVVTIGGSGRLSPIADLTRRLSLALRRPVTVRVRVIQEELAAPQAP